MAKTKRFVTVIITIILLSLISGCLDAEKDFIINPDGSGKVYVNAKISRFSYGMSELPEDIVRDNIKKMVEKSEGIDAWENVKYSIDEEDVISFSGTAYFKNLSELKISHINQLSFAFIANEDGSSIIKFKPKKEPDPKKKKVLSQEQLQAEADKARKKMKQSKLMMLSALPRIKSVARITLPGKIISKTGFNLLEDQRLEVVWDGERIAKSLDQLIEDEEFWKEQAASGLDFKKDGPVYNAKTYQLIFGDSNNIEVKFNTGGKALFDYEAEIQAAEKSYKKLLDELKDDYEKALPATKAGSIKNIEVGGVRIVWLEDSEEVLRPFYRKPGITMSIRCEFDGGVLGVSASSVKFITDSNQSLGFEEDRKNKSRDTRLSKDKTSCNFEIFSKLLPSESKFIREISGILKYSTASKTQFVDLGFAEILEESQGDRFSAKIQRVYETNGKPYISLRLKARKEQIRSFKFCDSNSVEISATSAGTSRSNDTLYYTFKFEKALPIDAKISAEIYGDYQEYELPFKIENVDFTGKQNSR